jgi:diacylglycerol O-acyltransferase / wax synthase
MDRLGTLDSSFLYLEKPNVHMHIAGLSVFDPSTRDDGHLGLEDTKDLIADRIHLVPRFRQKVRSVPFEMNRPVWIDDPNFDIDFHIRAASLPSPGGPRELAELVQRICSRPLDRTKPLWEMYRIDGLDDGHVAAITKVHHSMMDGLAGMQVAAMLFDFTREPRAVEPEPWHPQPEPSSRQLLTDAIVDHAAHGFGAIGRAAERAVRCPQEAVAAIGRTGVGFANLFGGMVSAPGPFTGSIGPTRRFSMADAPVSDAKDIKNALGGTVNDVILSSVAGALAHLLGSRGHVEKDRTLRAMVPVSLRVGSSGTDSGNDVSPIFVDLPVGPMDEGKRLARITAATRHLKESRAEVGTETLVELGGFFPAAFYRLFSAIAGRQRVADLIISNIPGPQDAMYFAGARLVAYYPVMPLAETMGLSVGVTSLAGMMGFSFTADWDAVPDVWVLSDGFVETFARLKKAAGV